VITAMPRIAIVVHDFDLAITTFRDAFGLPVADFSDRTVAKLGAHVAMCMPEGGSNIELMAPADPRKPLSQSLQKCLDRRGEGPYALMLEAPDPNREAEELSARGLAVLPLMAGAGGRDIHPRSTHGVLIRVYPDNSVRDPGGLVSGEPRLSGIAKVIVATADASVATDAYGRGLGLHVEPASDDEERGVSRAVCRPAKGGVIELVSAIDATRPFGHDIARFVKEEHEGMYALVLRAEDPAAAVALLADRGIAVGGTDGRQVSVFGTRFLIE
jgi:catechol 2,3-dioxygenase-like lactoylglutathione lyase family enzyme